MNDKLNITDLVNAADLNEKGDGNFKTICHNCGMQGGRTEGFIIFPETNGWYYHNSGTHGGILEYLAIKHDIIKCSDCLESGEKKNVLVGELFKETLDAIKDNYSAEIFESIMNTLKIRSKIELPGNGVLTSKFATQLSYKFKQTEDLFFRCDIQDVVEITPNGFRVIKPNRFITMTEMYFKPWAKVWQKSGDYVEVQKSMNQQTASCVLQARNFQDKLKKVERIFTVPLPVIYDGELTFPKKGYDPRFNSWLDYNSPTIDKKMTLKDAKEIIYYIYNEFCFQNEQDRVNAIAGLITPFLRGLFSDFNVRTPLFSYMANRERAGKDYCAGITGLVLEGIAIDEPAISSGESRTSGTNEELKKKILSALMSGKKRLHFANNKGRLNSAVLEGFLTSRNHRDRLLGKNESPNFSNEIDVSLSGNMGMTFTPDLANRARFINLFFADEDANDRKFENPDLHGWVLKQRESIISAIYTLIRNWFEKGQSKGKLSFASYPEWAEICGGIMEAAKIGNPCKKDKNASNGISVDEETDEMKVMFEHLYEVAADKWLNKTEIKDIIKEDDSIMTYVDWENRSHQTKFGTKIDKFVGRILSNIRLECGNLEIRASRRKYRFMKETATVNNGKTEGSKKDGVVTCGNLCTQSESPRYIVKLKRGQKDTKVTRLPKTKKTDREIQFYDAEECKSIKPQCTKKQILEYMTSNPKTTPKKLYNIFKTGSMKFYDELKEEGKI